MIAPPLGGVAGGIMMIWFIASLFGFAGDTDIMGYKCTKN
jgi:hypothetical protein